jgi:hypothetical protein
VLDLSNFGPFSVPVIDIDRNVKKNSKKVCYLPNSWPGVKAGAGGTPRC